MMPLTVSDAALNLIVTEEDGSEAFYKGHYEHFEWPQGASGPTIGIGYDCGYSTTSQARVDWESYVSEQTIEAILPACGRRGADAETFVHLHGHSVTITWDQAIAQFKGRELQQWIGATDKALPNCNKLSSDSFGALVSLSLNRGAGGYSNPSARYAEMRAIRSLMIAENFSRIPAEFLSMRRLWPAGGDLWRRRGHEATLFQQGLAK